MFDMPETGTWEEQSGWVTVHLANDLNFTLEQAAGFPGNFGVESEEFKTYHEHGQPENQGGVSWAQWTGSRRRSFEKWCAGQGLNPRTNEAAYGYLVFDLKSDFFLAAAVRKKQTVEEATKYIYEWYERPQEVLNGTYRSLPKRIAYAKRALAGAKAFAIGAVVASLPNYTEIDKEIKIEVEKLQTLLANRGKLYNDKIDGDPGPLTQKALDDWRKIR